MFWDAQDYGAHGGTAVEGPRTRWLFAEGSQGFFSTFVLLANPGATPATVTMTFLREGGRAGRADVHRRSRPRASPSRAGTIPELAEHVVLDRRRLSAPIIAERAMYFGTTRFWDGGHESAGVPEAPSRPGSWRKARPARSSTTFVLVGNPNATAGERGDDVPDGRPARRSRSTFTVPANGRLTVNIETQDPSLANVAVSTTVTSDLPVIAERAHVLAGHAAGVVRGAQQLRQHRRSAPSGAWPKGASAFAQGFRPTSCWPTRTRPGGAGADHVPARERGDRGEERTR